VILVVLHEGTVIGGAEPFATLAAVLVQLAVGVGERFVRLSGLPQFVGTSDADRYRYAW
jgi:hypothetical protein